MLVIETALNCIVEILYELSKFDIMKVNPNKTAEIFQIIVDTYRAILPLVQGFSELIKYTIEAIIEKCPTT